jgi:(p)ppGpp synthase/HD superfamily hydrolase
MSSKNTPWPEDFPEQIGKVTAFAARHFHSEVRKGTSVPYLSHLLSVAGLAMEIGAGPEGVLAAVLHDVLEDRPIDLSELEALAGPEVTRLVLNCSDSKKIDGEKAPWKERKLKAIEKIRGLDLKSLQVVLADKLHNSRCIVRDLESVGVQATFSRFSASSTEVAWYYTELALVFESHPKLGSIPEAQELLKNAKWIEQKANPLHPT